MTGEDDILSPEQQRVQELLCELRPLEPDPQHQASLRAAFLDGAFAEEDPVVPLQAPAGRAGWMQWIRWALVPAAAAAVVILVRFAQGPSWTLMRAHGAGDAVVNGETISLTDDDALAAALGAGKSVELGSDAGVELMCGDLALLEMTPGTSFTVPNRPGRWGNKTMRGHVAMGEMRFMSGPGFPGYEMYVTTPEGAIDLTGTIVSVFRNEDLTCVCVLEGEAMIGRDDEHMDAIPEGKRKVMFNDGRPPLISDFAAEHVAGLREFRDRNHGAFGE